MNSLSWQKVGVIRGGKVWQSGAIERNIGAVRRPLKIPKKFTKTRVPLTEARRIEVHRLSFFNLNEA
jgi:hypothetical protein